MITDYYIVRADTPDDLTKKVNDLIKKGWEPRGGVAIAQQLCNGNKSGNEPYSTLYDAGFYCLQAMVKKEPTK